MSYRLILFIIVFCFNFIGDLSADKGRIATGDDLRLLKKDVMMGKIKVGQTRLKSVRETYGEPASITENDRLVTFDYGDLKIVFDKTRIWKKWEYDSFRRPVYTDDVDDLRYDLASEKLVGENLTYTQFRKNYNVPTESLETSEDGKKSIYFYGDIKLTFENVFVVRSWQGQKLETATVGEGAITASNSGKDK